MITFIYDYLRFCYVYLIYSKDEALERFKIYESEVELKLDLYVKRLSTNKRGECFNPSYFKSNGIIHKTIAGYAPQSNGVVERKNETLQEMIISILSYSGLSEGFWGKAMLIASHILIWAPTKANNTSPCTLQ